MTVSVAVAISPTPPPGWDEFVARQERGSLYHLGGAAQVARRAFGFECHYLTARREPAGEVCGILPLVQQPALLRGRQLVSLPFFNYGGILAADDEVVLALSGAARNLATQLKVDSLQLRHAYALPVLGDSLYLDKATLLLQLPGSSAELFRSFDSKLRSQIRRAERERPEVRVGGAELLDDFYRVFCSVMRDLGTPVYPRRFFERVSEFAGARASVLLISLSGAAVAGAVLMRDGGSMEIPWAASLNRVKAQAINMRLYWEALQHAIAQGCAVFDFGRSTIDSGPYRFKRQWGATPRQLHWWHWTPHGARARGPAERRDSLKLAVELWQRLPLPVANWLGPRISPRLPW